MSSKAADQGEAAAIPPAGALQCSWPLPPHDIRLQPDEVHLWCAVLGTLTPHLPHFRSLLSANERERAARFHFSANRDAYIVRHGVLRVILSRYLMQSPGDIEFRYGEKGKPELKTDGVSLHFNDSHSADLALFAVTPICPVGVDIECVRPIPDFETIASRYFSPTEVERMRALSPDEKMKAFYSCWTGKEAYLKATGDGIGANLNQVEITLDQGLQATAVRASEDSEPSAEWQLRAFSPASGYLGAVALQGAVTNLRQWRVPADLEGLPR